MYIYIIYIYIYVYIYVYMYTTFYGPYTPQHTTNITKDQRGRSMIHRAHSRPSAKKSLCFLVS